MSKKYFSRMKGSAGDGYAPCLQYGKILSLICAIENLKRRLPSR